MKRNTAMLTGAAAMALGGGAVMAPVAMADPIPAASSYADLLEPVPDARARLHADDALADSNAHLIPAQLNIGIGVGHHHHHHHHYSARWYRNHGYVWNGQMWVIRPRMHHHHHHHHMR
jgi:hypothetical protein